MAHRVAWVSVIAVVPVFDGQGRNYMKMGEYEHAYVAAVVATLSAWHGMAGGRWRGGDRP